MRKLVFFLVVILGAAILAAVFLPLGGTDEDKMKNTIKDYNKNLIIALQSDSKIMKEVATEREQGRIDIFISQMADERKIIDARLIKLNIKSVKILSSGEWQGILNKYRQEHRQDLRVPAEGALKMYKTGALAQTDEVWSYQYLDAKTREKINKPNLLGYEVTYTLVKENDKWKVADVIFKEKEIRL